AVSSVFFCSVCGVCLVCAEVDWCGTFQPRIKTKTRIGFISRPKNGLLAQKLARHGRAGLPDLVDLVLRLIFQFIVMFECQSVFRCKYAELFEPLGIDIQTPRAYSHRSREKLLAVPAQ